MIDLESLSLSHVLGVIAILLLARYFYKLIVVEYWPLRKIPGRLQLLPHFPFRIPFLADVSYHGSSLNPVQQQYGKHTNGLVRVTAYGQSGVVVSDPKHLKEIFLTKANTFVKPPLYDILEIFGPNIVTLEGGPLWKKHRVLSDPCFSDAHLKYLTGITAQSLRLLLQRMERRHADEIDKTGGFHWKDVKDDIVLITMDVIGKAGFGVDLGVMEDNTTWDVQRFKMAFADALGTASGIAIPLRALVPKFLLSQLPFFKFYRDAIEDTGKYIDELIESARRGTSNDDEAGGDADNKHVQSGLDLLTLLVRNNEDSASAGHLEEGDPDAEEDVAAKGKRRSQRESLTLTDQELKSDTLIFLIAGHETSSSLLQWTLYELCKNLDVQEKLRRHIDEVLQGRDPVYEDMEKLEYVYAVMKESLRVHPPVRTIVKTNTKRVKFEGFDIPKRTLFFVNIEGVHHDPRIWTDPEKFNPDRFMSDNARKVKPLHYLPFSFGLRRCSGFRFSQIEVVTLLAMLIQRYEFSFPEDVTTDPKSYEIPVSHHATQFPSGLRLVVKKRSAAA